MMNLTRSQQENITLQVLQHHLKVLGAGDVESTVFDYALEAVVITAEGIVRGHEEIRQFFENSITNVLPPGCNFTMLSQIVEGEIAHIVWQADTPFYNIPLGTDTFIIREGKITSQTFTGILNAKEKS